MKPFSCDAFIALEGDSGRRSDLHDKPSTERGWLVAIGDLDKCPCIGYPTHGRPSVCLVSVGYRELRSRATGLLHEVLQSVRRSCRFRASPIRSTSCAGAWNSEPVPHGLTRTTSRLSP